MAVPKIALIEMMEEEKPAECCEEGCLNYHAEKGRSRMGEGENGRRGEGERGRMEEIAIIGQIDPGLLSLSPILPFSHSLLPDRHATSRWVCASCKR
jgi:hypothetical protein